MAYNEPVWAGVWATHYARQLGAEHCTLLDHGSDDGSTSGLPVQVKRLPRSALDEVWRASVVAEEVARLLRTYDAVFHTDVDELLVADPRWYDGLRTFASKVDAPVVTAIGLDLHHLPAWEADLDLSRPIGSQREWVRFSASMCKPVLVRRTVKWAPGFHCCDAPMVLDRLYLLHMRYADLAAGLRRLARTRSQVFADAAADQHQRVSDSAFEGMMRSIAELPREDVDIDPSVVPLAEWLDRLRISNLARAGEVYTLDLGLAGDALWRLGPQMRDML